MTVLALDWNATRLRAVAGLAGETPRPLPLESPRLDLPLAISLANRIPELGSAALAQCRRTPQQVCQAFLPHLSGKAGHGPTWQSGRHSLDARRACDLVWRKIQSIGLNPHGVLLCVPGYLLPAQADALRQLGDAARLPVLGSAPTTLAAALAGHAALHRLRSALVIDVDDHALTVAHVEAGADNIDLVKSRPFPDLGLRCWRERLLNALSDAFVREHRLDPRAAPLAEQSLFDQLDGLTEAVFENQAIALRVQGKQWSKDLVVHPEQTLQFCQALVQQVVREATAVLQHWPAGEWPRTILLTHCAGRLPGLTAALQTLVLPRPSRNPNPLPQTKASARHDEDFGEDLVLLHEDEMGLVHVLEPFDLARAVHGLAEHFQAGKLAPGHLDRSVPLAPAPAVDFGSPRLRFLDAVYPLGDGSFVLGSRRDSNLVLERSQYPSVEPRHCEILGHGGGFTLRDRHGAGTYLNEELVEQPVALRAGDRIRLGPEGPTVRFLGGARPKKMQLA